ncbi:MAG: ABC transporter ATP-binding protein [Lautropia sp.]
MSRTAPDTTCSTILEIDRLSAGYTDEPIVVDFSATIPGASVTTVIGPNGAGKSTLLRAIYGTCRHFGGELRFLGQPIEALAPARRLALGIGFVPQGRCNFQAMSVRENLELGAYTLAKGAAKAATDRVLELFPALSGRLDVLAGNLSGGEQQILETAMVLQVGPKLLLLDEPSLGLSPQMQEQVFDQIAGLRARGLSVLVIEQNAYGALEISDYGIVMELGRLIMMAPARQVLSDPRVRQAYLGAGATSS